MKMMFGFCFRKAALQPVDRDLEAFTWPCALRSAPHTAPAPACRRRRRVKELCAILAVRVCHDFRLPGGGAKKIYDGHGSILTVTNRRLEFVHSERLGGPVPLGRSRPPGRLLDSRKNNCNLSAGQKPHSPLTAHKGSSSETYGKP